MGPIAKVHGGVQAGGCRALQKVRDGLRGGGARAGLRRRGLSDWVKKADAADCGRATTRSRWPRTCASSAPTAPTWRGSPTSLA